MVHCDIKMFSYSLTFQSKFQKLKCIHSISNLLLCESQHSCNAYATIITHDVIIKSHDLLKKGTPLPSLFKHFSQWLFNSLLF